MAKAPTVPTNLREFLQFCNVTVDGMLACVNFLSTLLMQCVKHPFHTASSIESSAMIASNDDKIEIAVNQLPNDVITGQNAATSQGCVL